jgi:hypothetical protein
VRALAFVTTLLFLALAAEPAAAWMPNPVEFQRGVSLPGGAHKSGGWVTTSPVRTARRFDLVGVQWRGRSALKIELRARSHAGRWTRWASAGAGADGPDPPEARTSSVRTGEPLWAGGSDAVQLRLSGRAAGLRLRLINTTGTATRRDRARTVTHKRRAGPPGTLPLPVTNAGPPAIVPRAAWGANHCKPRVTPSFGHVQMAFVHHTVSLNDYSRSQAAAVVLGICLFHRNGNGWNDIGYNFLVDRHGQVFEGRAGGIDQPVLGAQAGGFNAPSTGVSVIGDFSRVAPPKVAMESLARVLAWKLSIHGVPAKGRTTVTSGGGPFTAYRAGTLVTLQRVSGHRDADTTACPGAAFYKRLPALRRRVAKLEGPISGLTLTTPTPDVQYGATYNVSGVLTLPNGVAGANEAIELRALSGGHEQVVGSAITAPDGSWSVDLPAPQAHTVVRGVFAGSGGERPGVISPVIAVRPIG